MACHGSEDVDNLLAFPHHVLERILGHLDQVQDILALGSASRATQAALAHASWTGVQCLRLYHGAPSPASAAWITAKCPGLVELHAEGCTQLTSESLQGFSQAALEVLRLGESTSLRGKAAAAAVLAIAQNGKLHELALPPYLQGLQGVMPDTLQESKDLRHLSLSRICWGSSVGSRSLGQLCPKLTHLTLDHCELLHVFTPFMGCPDLQRLSIHSSSLNGLPVGDIPFLSLQLKSVDVSNTSIADEALREIAVACQYLEHLNISRCYALTDAGIAALSTAPAVTLGRLWDLNISGMGNNFIGVTLCDALEAWVKAKLPDAGNASRTKGLPHLRLNISHNFGISPETLLGLVRPVCDMATRADISFQEFSAQSCTRLAGPYMGKAPTENVLRDLSGCGLFSELHTLNLTDVFSTSQQSEQQKESLLTDIIQGTCGELRRLYLANAHMGEEASQAIAHKCAQLKELSLPGCAGLTATGLKSIALACKHLQVLRIGGGLVRAREETDSLLAFKHLRRLEIYRRSLMSDEDLVQVLRQHPALEYFKLGCCPRISDEGLAALPASTLRELSLVCCDGVVGASLGRLKRLERLEFASCNAVTGDAIQVIAVSCTRLKELQLPTHVPISCLPTQAVGHLGGLQVTGPCAFANMYGRRRLQRLRNG
ncbi:hypothetical protein CVIRNUC_011066 [Coccomyxa viridis]|uniref:Uncharacterized protein n=1 Tax=Coccomyxa viridis TaxID=1274662 RepID=A0AAV1IKK2_9CHLO|nr:hypothetical protein CVIRNUC_011066 [Coccomyxa viridis]